MVKKKRLQKNAESKILEHVAKYGPSHMYPLHEAKSNFYIASRGTIHRAKDNLLKQAFIELKREEKHTGKDKRIYGLTFSGLLHFLKKANENALSNSRECRLRNNLRFPIPYDFKGHGEAWASFCELVENVSPKDFYAYLRTVDASLDFETFLVVHMYNAILNVFRKNRDKEKQITKAINIWKKENRKHGQLLNKITRTVQTYI